jgi:hypothetical protein
MRPGGIPRVVILLGSLPVTVLGGHICGMYVGAILDRYCWRLLRCLFPRARRRDGSNSGQEESAILK